MKAERPKNIAEKILKRVTLFEFKFSQMLTIYLIQPVKWLDSISVMIIVYASFKHNNEDTKKEIKLFRFKVG